MLLYEFSFGQLNSAKGEKRLLPAEAFEGAKTVTVKRYADLSVEERSRLARECREKLAAYPALTRRELAWQLDVTTTWLNQLMKRP